ncbi:MAG TPA: DUF883 family protein [Burkholderiales bacterium]|nr:DUF883 family protein [Burkholderiales bacterium]
MDAASDKLTDELRAVVAAAEELLGATAAQAGANLDEVRARTEEVLRLARGRLEGAGRELEEQVRRHPLAALGIAAGIGIVLGVLIARK